MRSNAVDVIVVDSVAALVPRAELDGDMGDSLPGLQARLMSQALRKLTAAISRSGCSVIFINQIREKIGVMFGCMSYDTRVSLADGTSEKIGKIVNQRLPVEVLSYDAATGRIEPRRVVNWFDNGRTDHFLQFEVEGGPSGRRRFGAPRTTSMFTPGGAGARRRAWRSATRCSRPSRTTASRTTSGRWCSAAAWATAHPPGRRARATSVSGTDELRRTISAGSTPCSRPSPVPSGPTGRGVGFDTFAMPALADLPVSCYDADGGRMRRGGSPRPARCPRDRGLVRRRRLVRRLLCPLGQGQGRALQQGPRWRTYAFACRRSSSGSAWAARGTTGGASGSTRSRPRASTS